MFDVILINETSIRVIDHYFYQVLLFKMPKNEGRGGGEYPRSLMGLTREWNHKDGSVS